MPNDRPNRREGMGPNKTEWAKDVVIRAFFLAKKPNYRNLWKFLSGLAHSKNPQLPEDFIFFMAGTKGLEPSTSCVTGMRSNQLNYTPKKVCSDYSELSGIKQELISCVFFNSFPV